MAHSLTRVTMTPEKLEARRMKAASLFERRVRPSTIAEQLGVSKVAVHYWHKTWKERGTKGLEKRTSGPTRLLSDAQLNEVEAQLLAGPIRAGYATDLWTLERVRRLIASVANVRYGQTQVWRILGRLGWSCQRPERRSRERDEKAIAHWKKVTWPAIKKKGAKTVSRSFSKTNRGTQSAHSSRRRGHQKDRPRSSDQQVIGTPQPPSE